MDDIDLRICSQSKCTKILPPEHKYGFKQCAQCRETNRSARAQARKRKREDEPPSQSLPAMHHTSQSHGSTHEDPLIVSSGSGSDDGNQSVSLHCCNNDMTTDMHNQTLVSFKNSQKHFSALRRKCRGTSVVEFDGTFSMAEDPLVTDKERVQMLTHEVWKVTGWHFRYVTNMAHEV
jgi:hypothetical protein